MLSSLKGFLRARFPVAWRRAQRAKDRVRDELRLIQRLGARGAMRLLRSRHDVERVASASQYVRTFVVDAESATDDVEAWLRQRGAEVATGLHAVYVPPDSLAAAGLAALKPLYPAGAGVKILRSVATDDGRYLRGEKVASLQDAVAYRASGLATVGNALAWLGISPRVFDLCRVQIGSAEHVAFVVEHVPAPLQEAAQFTRGRAAIDSLLARGDFLLVDAQGRDGHDFAPPDGNGNFRVRADGTVAYVDTQNFVFRDYRAYLAGRAKDWVDPSHFGDKAFIRGGRYLYQSVPGLAQPGKRDTRAREQRYNDLLATAGVSIAGRVIFDIGGNIGRMSAFALQQGARWTHLWDMPATAAAAEEALLLTGFTRCSTTGGPLVKDKDLRGDLPAHLRTIAADEGVVFYLAIHHHVGWLERLGDLPWRHLVFEGPEDQTQAQVDDVIGALHARTPVRVLARSAGSDGDSRTRLALVVERLG